MADIPRVSEYIPGHVPQKIDESLIGWLRREFKHIASGFSAINQTRVRAVFGSMGGVDDDPFPDIGLTYQNIDNYLAVEFEYGINFDNVAGTFSFTTPGWFTLSFLSSLEHAESNAGRETFIRLFDVTKGVESSAFNVGVARNQPSTNISLQFMVAVSGDIVGNEFVFQIGGGDTFTSCNWNSKTVQISSIGP